MTDLPDYADLPPAPHGGRSAWGLFGAGDNLGLVLGELWWLADLAADCATDGVHEMFCVSAPLNAPGGIGSPANAVAIK